MTQLNILFHIHVKQLLFTFMCLLHVVLSYRAVSNIKDPIHTDLDFSHVKTGLTFKRENIALPLMLPQLYRNRTVII